MITMMRMDQSHFMSLHVPVSSSDCSLHFWDAGFWLLRLYSCSYQPSYCVIQYIHVTASTTTVHCHVLHLLSRRGAVSGLSNLVPRRVCLRTSHCGIRLRLQLCTWLGCTGHVHDINRSFPECKSVGGGAVLEKCGPPAPKQSIDGAIIQECEPSMSSQQLRLKVHPVTCKGPQHACPRTAQGTVCFARVCLRHYIVT